ncbi:unnamed protein product [Ectocarpus sp. 8 AP-2014]
MCGFKCVGQCCGLLSLFGIFFLFSVGHMFASQPMFTDVEVWEEHHDHDASVNCYIGGVIYICTLAASVGCFCFDKKRSARPPTIAHQASTTSYLDYTPENVPSPGQDEGAAILPRVAL